MYVVLILAYCSDMTATGIYLAKDKSHKYTVAYVEGFNIQE